MRVRVHRSPATGAPAGALPVAHTCNHELELPLYPSRAILEEKLALALASASGFELA